MRRAILVLALLLASLTLEAAPAYAPTTCRFSDATVSHAFHPDNEALWGRFVSAELARPGDQQGDLRARADVSGLWERYRLECLDPFQSVYAIKSVANGRYVSAEIGWTGDRYGQLRARATAVGPWERFRITEDNEFVAIIRSMANNSLVTEEAGWTGDRRGLLRARGATSVGDWERFIIY